MNVIAAMVLWFGLARLHGDEQVFALSLAISLESGGQSRHGDY